MRKKDLTHVLNKHRLSKLSSVSFFAFESSFFVKDSNLSSNQLFLCKGFLSKESSFIDFNANDWSFFNKLYVVEDFCVLQNHSQKLNFIFYRGLDGLVFNKAFLKRCLAKRSILIQCPYRSEVVKSAFVLNYSI